MPCPHPIRVWKEPRSQNTSTLQDRSYRRCSGRDGMLPTESKGQKGENGSKLQRSNSNSREKTPEPSKPWGEFLSAWGGMPRYPSLTLRSQEKHVLWKQMLWQSHLRALLCTTQPSPGSPASHPAHPTAAPRSRLSSLVSPKSLAPENIVLQQFAATWKLQASFSNNFHQLWLCYSVPSLPRYPYCLLFSALLSCPACRVPCKLSPCSVFHSHPRALGLLLLSLPGHTVPLISNPAIWHHLEENSLFPANPPISPYQSIFPHTNHFITWWPKVTLTRTETKSSQYLQTTTATSRQVISALSTFCLERMLAANPSCDF